MKRRAEEPQTRIGHCCGCGHIALLYKVAGIFRYRCSACFQRETRARHYLDVRLTPMPIDPAVERANIGSEDDGL